MTVCAGVRVCVCGVRGLRGVHELSGVSGVVRARGRRRG